MMLLCRSSLLSGSVLFWVSLFGPTLQPQLSTGATPDTVRRFEFASIEMGTLFRIVLYGEREGEAAAASQAAFQRVRELDRLLSDYRADSELNRVCRGAVGVPRVVSRELYSVLEKSIQLSRFSGGAFDVTVGPLVHLWREARRGGRLPQPSRIEAARERSGFRLIVLNSRTRSVRLLREKMQLDLGGIAKGYAADEALAILQHLGFPRALIEAGGDIRIGQAPPGRLGWRVALRGSEFNPAWQLSDAAVATSGDDLQFVEVGGRRYSHVIDPRTGMASTQHRLVTVVAGEALTADGLATALSVMEPEDGLRLVARFPGASARIELRTRGRVFESDNFPAEE